MTIDKMCVSAQTFCQSGDRNSSSSLRRNLTAIEAIFDDLFAIKQIVCVFWWAAKVEKDVSAVFVV